MTLSPTGHMDDPASDAPSEIHLRGQYIKSGERKRAQILQSAARCFLQSGFAETTLEQIAAESGFVKQTVYNYFDTKDALFKATVASLLPEFAIELDQRMLDLPEQEFLLKVSQFQLSKLNNRKMTDFLQLAVKECKNFPDLQSFYASVIVDPMIDFTAGYLIKNSLAPADDARRIAWCFRSAVTGFGTMLNLGSLISEQLPVKKTYLEDVAKLFARQFGAIGGSDEQSQSTETESSLSDIKAFFADGSKKRFAYNQASILSAAVQTFSEKGFAETTMEQIAAVANVSKQTVYTRFKSKDALYKVMCDETFKRLRLARAAKLKDLENTPDAIAGYCRVLLDEVHTDWVKQLYRVIIGESKAFPQEANLAIYHIFDFNSLSSEQEHPVRPQSDNIEPTSLGLVLNGIIGSYVLVQKVFYVGTSDLTENRLILFIERLFD